MHDFYILLGCYKIIDVGLFNSVGQLLDGVWLHNIGFDGSSSYSVMQLDVNSFCGDVVSGSFNKTSWDEDILDQINKRKYVRIIIMMILILYNILRKCILTLQ